MTFQEIFDEMYTLYRSEAQVPGISDDEWTIGLRLANEAIGRWENYDNTFWNTLYDTASIATVQGQTQYDCPADMRAPGGWIKNGMLTVNLVSSEEVQFLNTNSNFAYFTGDPNNGYKLNMSRASQNNTDSLTFMYYKKASKMVDGDSTPEMTNPHFIVDRMLANRIRTSNNYGFYQTAFRDAEDALKNMKLENDSGSWGNPAIVPDRSGAIWGQGYNNDSGLL